MGTHLYSVTLSIALLICDVPIQAVQEQYGNYVTLFENLFYRAAESFGTKSTKIDLKITPFNVMEQQYPASIDDFSSYVMTGSKYSAYENIEWINKLKDFVRQLDQHPTARLFGVCFGHQIIAEALGGKVEKNPKGWEVGWSDLDINDEGRKALVTEKMKLRLHQMHQDHVTEVPANFTVLASSDICPVHLMVKGNRILAVQGHPEFHAGVATAIVNARKESGVFTADFADNVLQQLCEPTDDLWFAEKAIGFLSSRPARD
ncbi:class I glutamine amidotransferase-like protein [Phlyctochytrium arcticum]|nr:class I glutamine amidotransferase-like protein [Phlyctochytrium arcticum]